MNKYKSHVLIAVLFFCVGLLLAHSILSLRVSQTQQVVVNEIDEKTIYSTMIDYGDGNVKVYELVDRTELSVFEVIQRIAKDNEIDFDFEEYAEMGILVKKIGYQQNGVSNRYWQYWVNNQFAMVSADKNLTPKSSNVFIEWKFAPMQPFE